MNLLINLNSFGLKTVFFELLHACRIIRKLTQKVSLGSETCKIERKHFFNDVIENVVFGLQNVFFDSFNVLLSFLAGK